ncbi:MAG: sn-glycerol-3-phosphate ABC transporter ATP-binding protein UgpC [Rhizobiales bacterium]|nr:sn-glycerol-3-phosphate ABC transporter ATP-binding protein UgpC [Hyphomicrobiales bacterium]
MASVTLRNIRKNYGNLEVIHGVDLTIDDGSFVVLLGPSGCGKSTLLRSIAGLESINSGDISIGDRRVNDEHPKDRDIAMVFQNYALYAHMNVKDNMSFSLKLAKRPQSEIDEKTSWAAKILNLEPYMARFPRELSGGQRQRVAMGRAIVRNPAVFLFDEPLSNLDAKLRVQMRTEIKELHERLKTTTVYVTHDQIEAMTMADKIVILRDGVIEQEGSPLEVYDHPANLFVASFIGSPSMNLIKGTVTKGAVVAANGTRLPLPPKDARAREGQKVVYGIRPEDLELGKGFDIALSVTEPTGPELHVYGDMGEEEICAVLRERADLKRGSTVSLAPRLDRVHLFDADTGKAL